jgi:hypothetical protein
MNSELYKLINLHMENFKNITDELINIFQSFASIIGPFFFKIALVVVLVIIG